MIKMAKTLKYLIIIFIFICLRKANAQHDFFHDIVVSKTIYSADNKNIYSIMPGWKHIYNDIGWRRWSVIGQYKRQLNMWSIGGGVGGFYTFDKDIKNNLELRPYVLVGLKTSITKNMIFAQSLKGELRTFFYKETVNNFNTNRLRYNLNVVAIINDNIEKKIKWKLRPEVEWYIQKNANVKERFVNSTEYTLTLLRESKKVEIGIGYRYERFNRNLLVPDPNGQTISIELNF